MELELSGKVALVTGSSRGIGYAIAKMLHTEGCQVVLNGRSPEFLDKASCELPGSVAMEADVTDPKDVDKLVAKVLELFGRLDILICNVGSGKSVAPGCETIEEWNRVFEVNLWSTINTVSSARKALSLTGGTIVCTSSICGVEIIPGAPVTYSVAKSALNAYIRGISRPLAREGIRINGVAPGNVLFEGSVWAKKLTDNPEAVQAMLDQDVALMRLGGSEEIADLVVFLASKKTSFATGSIWTLDGGQVHS